MSTESRVMTFLFAAVVVVCVGCSDTTGPAPTREADTAAFDGALDPEADTFVLRRLKLTTNGAMPVAVDLVGSNLRVDPLSESVHVDVALRNAGNRTLYPPAMLWLSDFLPSTVTVTNADWPPPESTIIELDRYGFDYSRSLGNDGSLEAGETSGFREWIFHDPGLVAFGFAAELEVELEPGPAEISGVVFEDRNENGIHERNEDPWLGGMVLLRGPDDRVRSTFPDRDGVFRFRVREAGLYELRLESVVDCVTCITTANPLSILLPAGPDGQPESYSMARLGAVYAPCGSWQGSVEMTSADPGAIEQDVYDLLGFDLDGDELTLRVGFSGCQDDHPFTLWAGREFAESNPVQTWVLLQHDDLGEDCRAYWQRTLRFDLRPIQETHVEYYGDFGPVLLRLIDYFGETHEVLYEP